MNGMYPGGYFNHPGVGGDYAKHESTVVEPQARIGAGTVIQPMSIVRDGAVVGSNSLIYSFVEVESAFIGDGVTLWNNSKVRIGAHIGNGATIGFASVVHAKVTIGEGVQVQSYVSLPYGLSVAPFAFIGPGAKFANDRHPRAAGPGGPGSFRKIEVGLCSTIGAGATVIGAKEGVRYIGDFAFVAAGAIAVSDVRPFALVVGKEQVGWVNAKGDTISADPTRIPSVQDCLFGLEADLRADGRLDQAQVQGVLNRAQNAAERLI